MTHPIDQAFDSIGRNKADLDTERAAHYMTKAHLRASVAVIRRLLAGYTPDPEAGAWLRQQGQDQPMTAQEGAALDYAQQDKPGT